MSVNAGADIARIASWLGEREGPLSLYALADPAQDATLPAPLIRDRPAQCLFSTDYEAPVAKVSPHLVELPPIGEEVRAWRWIERHALESPSVTVIAAPCGFASLLAHLVGFLDVRFDDGAEMFLAYWGPAVLGSLVGQADDATLHVSGPIFSPAQRAAFLAPLAAWWYWDRAGALHRIEPSPAAPERREVLPLHFTQAQVELIVEASVPDHVLGYLRDNTPDVLIGHAPADHYRRVREQIGRARGHGLTGTGDLVNYCAVAFSLGFDFDRRADVAPILARVKAGEGKFDAVLDVLEAAEKTQ